MHHIKVTTRQRVTCTHLFSFCPLTCPFAKIYRFSHYIRGVLAVVILNRHQINQHLEKLVLASLTEGVDRRKACLSSHLHHSHLPSWASKACPRPSLSASWWKSPSSPYRLRQSHLRSHWRNRWAVSGPHRPRRRGALSLSSVTDPGRGRLMLPSCCYLGTQTPKLLASDRC